MLILAHTGITLGLALGVDKSLPGFLSRQTNDRLHEMADSLRAVADHIDYRLIVIGSMLPDIIDKPLGHWIIPSLENGRIFCHTLIFLLALVSIGIWRYRGSSRTGILVLSFGSGIHLVLDQMWNEPATILWPFLGISFHEDVPANVMEYIKEALLHDATVYIPEIIGFLILGIFALYLLRRSEVFHFIRTGAL